MDNSHLLLPVFTNSRFLRQFLEQIPIPDKYKLDNIKNGKIVLKSHEDYYRTLDSLRFHMAETLPKCIVHYTIKHSDLDLSNFALLIKEYFTNNKKSEYITEACEHKNSNIINMLFDCKHIISKRDLLKLFKINVELFEKGLEHLDKNSVSIPTHHQQKNVIYEKYVKDENLEKILFFVNNSFFDRTRNSGLFDQVIKLNKLEFYKKILKNINISVCYNNHLNYAITYDKINFVKFIVEEISVEMSTCNLFSALKSAYFEISKYALDREIATHPFVRIHDIKCICEGGNVEVLKYLSSKYKVNFEKKDVKNQLLFICADNGNYECMKFLHKNKCSFSKLVYHILRQKTFLYRNQTEQSKIDDYDKCMEYAISHNCPKLSDLECNYAVYQKSGYSSFCSRPRNINLNLSSFY